MLRKSLVVAIALFVLATVDVYSQDTTARSSELATALNKTKYKKKEKPMVTVEFYIDIKNTRLVQVCVPFCESAAEACWINPRPNLVSRVAISFSFFPFETVRLTKTASNFFCSPFE